MKRHKTAALLSVGLAVALLFSGCGKMKSAETAAIQPTELRLQDDFYTYTNDKLLQEKKSDDDAEGWDQFSERSDALDRQLKDMASSLLKNRETYETGSTERTVADLYQTALDKSGREQTGLGALKPYADAVKSADSIPAYLDAVAKIKKDLGKSSLLTFEVHPDPRDSSRYALFLEEPMQLVKKEQMESGDMSGDINTYISSLLQADGLSSAEAEKWSGELFTLYEKFSKTALSQTEKNNTEHIMNYFTLEQLQAKLLNINLSDFLKKSGQAGYGTRVVINPAMLSVINSSLTEEHLELLKKYTLISLYDEYALYLNSKFSQANATFNQLDPDENTLAWDAVSTLATMELGELYAKEHFNKEKKDAVQKLVSDILTAYRANIRQLDWLSEESRQAAVKKIDAMVVKIGYPEHYQSYLKGIIKSTGQGGSFIDNTVAVHQQSAAADQRKAKAIVDREEWLMSPVTLNAYYAPSANEIVFPAAMLQAPFYDEKASYAANLGGIGSIIAHEITHAFDDMGALYDEKGNYRNWWTDRDRQSFLERSKKVVDYFSAYEVIPGLKVDGELTLGENIADLGSLSVISSMLRNDTAALKEMYESYANIWATAITEEELKDQIQNDNHAPSKARVNAVLSSTDDFYTAFDIKEGDGMYIPPEKRVKLY